MKTRDVKTPVYSSEQAAGMDFYIPNDIGWESKTLLPGESVTIPSGIIVELPPYLCLLLVNKSGVGKRGLDVGACLIDPDYRGEIHLNVFNQSNQPVVIRRGEKLVQAIAIEHFRLQLNESNNLSETTRGNGGFGSTGLN